MGIMDRMFGKRNAGGGVDRMSKEEAYDAKAPKFKDAKVMEGVMHEGKLIMKGQPGYDEALKAASERAKTVEDESIEIDADYQEEVRGEVRRRSAEAIQPHEPLLKAKMFTPEDVAEADKVIEAGIRRGEAVIEEALRDLELERSLADDDGLKALKEKEAILTRARNLFRQYDPHATLNHRFEDIRGELTVISSEAEDRAGGPEAAAVISRAIESMSKFS